MSLFGDFKDNVLVPVLQRTRADVVERLKALGYLSLDKIKDIKGIETSQEFIDALLRFQEFNGLLPDGDIGDKTLRVMFRPSMGRCALPDIMPARTNLCAWNNPNVGICPRLILSQLTPEQVLQAFQAVCDAWNSVCGINLVVTRNAAQAAIIADSGQGARDNFDGPSGTLAWSQLPCSGSDVRLQQKYDIDENWNVRFLTIVAMHEVGHAIGLDHLSAGNLMQPTYDDRIDFPQAGDIKAVVDRYGPPTAVKPVPQPVPTPTPIPRSDDEIVSALLGKRVTARIESIG